ncbi:unnamed protein product [Phytophthora fragariaefolia]|uniref:Unnamed protein product n=1 Tax=Phytophthora fragariaefolia TaxID=1490495 RepID=A0A9W6TZD8_9STRA|nr:unnamed protein product [Phytophthora fragariaefolia]
MVDAARSVQFEDDDARGQGYDEEDKDDEEKEYVKSTVELLAKPWFITATAAEQPDPEWMEPSSCKCRPQAEFGLGKAPGARQTIMEQVAEFTQLGTDPSRVLTPKIPQTKRSANGERFRSTACAPRWYHGPAEPTPPPAHGAICDIDVQGHKPIKQQARRVPLKHLKKLYKILKGLLKADLIAFSNSPWASPIVIVLKKNGVNIRLCIDYKMVNAITVLMEYAMPLVDDLVTELVSYLWFCQLDAASGFWAVMITQRRITDNVLWGYGGWVSHAEKVRRAEAASATQRGRLSDQDMPNSDSENSSTKFEADHRALAESDPLQDLVNCPESDMFANGEPDESTVPPVFDHRSITISASGALRVSGFQRATGGVLELQECSIGASPTQNDCCHGGHGVRDAYDYVDERTQAQATHGECEDLRTKGRGERAVLSNTERVYKPGLLVVQATVKGFEKPWTILIDSGASGNYARRSTMKESQLYAEALSARDLGIVTVRLATGPHVTVPTVPVDLGVKFLDFDSVERCLVLDLDARYDIILGMAWLERHEPWIDWRLKTLGTMHFSPSGALTSHEHTSARKQKGFWLEHWTETVNVLDIGISEMMDTEQRSHDARKDDELLLDTKDGIVGATLATHGRRSVVECGVAHNPLSGGCGQSNTSLSVGRDTEARLVLEEVRTPEGTADPHTTVSRVRTTSSKRRRRRKTLDASRMVSEISRDVNGVVSGTALHDSEQLYILVNEGTGDVDGDVNLGAVPTLAALLELDEMSFDESGEALQAGELAEVVVLRPEEELNLSSLLDEAVVEDAKKALNARSGSEILKNPSDPFYPVAREYQEVVAKEPPSGLPPDRGVRHEIDLVPGTKCCVTRQWPSPRERCDVIDAFFRAKNEAGLVRESKAPHSTPTLCIRKPNGEWRIIHAFNKLNAASLPAQTPIPKKDVLHNNMVGCTLYSALNLVDVYYQLLMRASDIPLTAVSTPGGVLWEWLVIYKGYQTASDV